MTIAACTRVSRPTSLSALFDSLDEVPAGERAYYLAGGTDLLVKAKDGVLPRARWIDLTALAHELAYVREELGPDGSSPSVRVGALTTFTDAERSELLERAAPALVACIPYIGSPQIRNRGTLGGNAGNGSPAADAVPPLYTLGTRVVLASRGGGREVPIEELFLGPGKTVVGPKEVIAAFRFPRRDGTRGTFLRLGQREQQAISKVSVAVTALFERASGTAPIVKDVRIAFGSVAPTVIRAPATERLLAGRPLDEAAIGAAAASGAGEVRPIDDIRSTADYRREQAGILLARALRAIAPSAAGA